MVIIGFIAIDVGFINDSFRHWFLVHYHPRHHPLNPKDPCHRHRIQHYSWVNFKRASEALMANLLLLDRLIILS